jgi:hypothetical protein
MKLQNEHHVGVAFNPVYSNFAIGGTKRGRIHLLKIDYSLMKITE